LFKDLGLRSLGEDGDFNIDDTSISGIAENSTFPQSSVDRKSLYRMITVCETKF